MLSVFSRRAIVVVAAVAATPACTIHDSNTPPLSGPSQLALTLNVNAVPDSVSQNGSSQSSIKVTAIGPDGRGVPSVPIRLDMIVNGVAQDYGTLDRRSIVTGADGTASAVYMAPPRPTNGVFTGCAAQPQLIGNCVTIVATATGTNFVTSNPQTALIRLMPEGVIIPPTQGPTARFTFVPLNPLANSPAQFDASTSCGGPLSGSPAVCPASSPSITSYSWDFGDGQTGSGRTASHSFALQQSYTVTLTVTNELGASNSTSQVVTVGAGLLPTPVFTASPTDAAVGQLVFFNGMASSPGQGHYIASYRWTFGDGTTGSGATVSHAYAAAGVYRVQLTVVDESGQSKTSDATAITVGIGNTGPTAVFTYSPASPVPFATTVTFDATPSTGTPAGSAPVIFQWQFECAPAGCTSANPVTTTTSPTITHVYLVTGPFSVTLTVFDTAGRSGTTSRLISVQ